MAGRVQQDAFIDDSDESCPLCVEEFDLSDKNFRPCPCGYQVCQFCYNNIKNHMNGLCPACRRPYDDQSIEWKIVSPEEQKADLALQARKRAMARKKESEQRQVETLNRKNLAGIRVVQKNLVYVVGLSQKSSEEEFLRTLRGPQYFGQYGKITKIVVSKAKEGQNGNNSIGVYVTFENKDDAAKCIAAVDGSQNLDRPLRAQYGTTKYCSAFLRNETCGNRNCTFLHETGEDNDSFSRQDLSSMNALSTQRPAQQATSSKTNQQQPQPQPPPQAPQIISAASQAGSSKSGTLDEAMSRSDSGDGSALPSSASWATKNAHSESRRSSKPASVAASSPVIAQVTAHSQEAESRQAPIESSTLDQGPAVSNVPPAMSIRPRLPESAHPLDAVLKTLKTSNFKFTFDRSLYDEEQLKQIEAYPPLFDDQGGLVRYRLAKAKEQERQKQEEERNVLGAISAAEEEDEAPASGSLQLGGEPETQDGSQEKSSGMSAQPRSAIQPPFASSSAFPFSGPSFQASNAANLTRTLTPQQQQHVSLLRSQNSRQSPINNSQYQQGYSANTSSHHHQQSNPFQTQNQNQAFSTAQGHQRQSSRFSFANESSSASTAVKAVANPQLMAQQSAMMPSSQGKQFQNQPVQQPTMHSNHFYSGVQGPPPGLKSSGTPPISGGGMFGQGHGFASAIGGSAGIGNNVGTKNTNEELMRELLRTRNTSAMGQGPDLGKREFKFPFTHQHMTSDAPASNLLSSLYGSQLGAHPGYQDHNLQKQKKKGKKHRHANTSSSGGGGIVDLADPSILQARMHHGAAQGQFGAQGQVSSSRIPNAIPLSLPSDPPTTASSGKITAKTTPTPTPVPPGLSLPQDFPPLAAPSAPPPAPPHAQQKLTSGKAIKPVVPVLPTPTTRSTVTSKEQISKGLVKIAEQSSTAAEPTAARTGMNLASTKNTASQIKIESKDENSPVISNELKEKRFATPSKSANKKQRPGKIDISAAKVGSKKDVEEDDPFMDVSKPVVKGIGESSNVVNSSRPPTPGTAISQASTTSFARQSQQHATRIPPTYKSEIPSPSMTPSSRQVSRRPSLTSVNQPGTPVSERISDNASFTSATISRANSPPPSKIGSAPIRQVTKSQQKKERQARAKQAEVVTKVEEPIAKVEEVQAPIIGRKKKAKKEKTQGTAESTPTVTRPSSPTFKDAADEKATPLPAPTTPVKESKKGASKVVGDSKETETPSSPPTPATGELHKTAFTAASIFASLTKAGEISGSAGDMFKSVPGLNYRFEGIDLDQVGTDDPSDDQLRRVDQGEAVYIEQGPNNSVIMLPGRRSLRGLSPEQASRYLELRKQALFNGDVPSHQALDGLIPAPPPIDVAAMSSLSRRSSRPKKLINKFDTIAPLEPPNMNNTNAFGAMDGNLLDRKPSLSVPEAETQVMIHRKEVEILEKKLNALIKKNKRLLFGNAH